jgi:ribosome-binding protein aMBF1 (putative translation factor)
VVLDFKKELSRARFARVPDMEFSEDIIVRIDSGELDYARVIARQLAKLEKTKAYFENP